MTTVGHVIPSYKLAASVFSNFRSRARRSRQRSLSLVRTYNCSTTFVFGCSRHPNACTSGRLRSGIPRRVGIHQLGRVVTLRGHLSTRSGGHYVNGACRILIRNISGHSHSRLFNQARRGEMIMFSHNARQVNSFIGIEVARTDSTALGNRRIFDWSKFLCVEWGNMIVEGM